VIAYRAMVDVPKELVAYVARLLAAHRRAIGTPRGSRKLTCARQALMVLVWFGKNEDIALLGAGFGVSRATGYRYIAEGRAVLAAQARTCTRRSNRSPPAAGPTSYSTDRWSTPTAWPRPPPASKARSSTPGTRESTADPAATSGHSSARTGYRSGSPTFCLATCHDLTCAEQQQILATACWAASQLNLPTLADCGYEGAGHGVHIPIKRPADGRDLAIDNRTYNSLLRAQRAVGERAFALLKGRWRVLRHVTASPSHIGDIARGALVLTTFLHHRRTHFQ
jgi:hypothetical protein